MGIYDTDDDDDFQAQEPDNNVVRQLRKALKAEQARNKEFQAQLDTLSKATRERTVQDVLSSKGLKNPSKVAELVPRDIDPSPDAVSKWLEEYADVFGLEQQDAAPQVPADDVDALRRMDAASSSAPRLSGAAELEAKILAATSAEELTALLLANSG